MIHLTRPPAPAKLAGDGKKATAKLKRAHVRGAKEFAFASAIYGAPEVREALRAMHKGKCAFCESRLPQLTAGHVEHYRPKGEVQQDVDAASAKPGYYWLAYEWTNLLLACEWCNSRAKRRLFPLADPARRVRSHRGNLAAESPLLLNPAEADPASHLEFVGEEIKPRNGSAIGKTSIRIYRLDDEGLTEERRRKLHLFRALKKLSKKTKPEPEVTEALAEATLWEQRIQMGEIEYAAMLRTNI